MKADLASEQRLGERDALVRQLRFELEMLRMLQTV
jgi:hypothetical protein